MWFYAEKDPLTTIVDNVTGVLVGLLLVVATLLAVFGLVRAYRGRRRTELVITDIVAPKELSESLIAELSEELRRKVHRRLVTPAPRRASLKATVGKDVHNRIAEIPGIEEKEVGRIQEAILNAPRQEILALPGNALAAVSGGIRALKPEQAEGLIQMLSVALPGQRGLLVSSRVVCQRLNGESRMGLSVQVGPLGRGAEAWATFWCRDVIRADVDGFARPKWFDELLCLAAEWVMVYLLGTLRVESGRGGLRRLGRRRHAKERQALREILTAQWASYAMYDLHDERPDVALDWAEQALEDARHAEEILREYDYYFPSYLVGSIYELCGNCCVGLGERSPEDTTYPTAATEYFKKAADAFIEAESKLDDLAATETFRKLNKGMEWRERAEIVRIARLKNQLLVGNGRAALTALGNIEISPFDLESAINTACLYSVAAWVAGNNELDASTYRLRAARYVIDAVRRNPSIGYLRTDQDLNRGIDRNDLDWLLEHALTADHETLQQRLSAIAAGRPSSAPHLVEAKAS